MTVSHLVRAETLLRAGDVHGARKAAEAGLANAPEHAPLRRVLGVAMCHAGDVASGSVHLRRALELDPLDAEARVALAHALAVAGKHADALTLCDSGDDRLLRLRAWLLQECGDPRGSASAYEAVVATHPADWEAWNNLGNARRAAGDIAGAVEALGRAHALQPRIAPIVLNLGSALAEAGRVEDACAAFTEAVRLDQSNCGARLSLAASLRRLGRAAEALETLQAAADTAPKAVEPLLEIARTCALLRRLDDAEAAYRRAIAIAPQRSEAWSELGITLERANRHEELDALIAGALAGGVDEADLAYIRAVSLARRGATGAALAALKGAAKSLEPTRCAALAGRLADQLGDAPGAFAAYCEMNRLKAEDPAAPRVDPEGYLQRIAGRSELVTHDWFKSWSRPARAETRPSPVFLVGFPRSGTTLLDTLLMGHPAVTVLEEEPILQALEDRLGGWERLPAIGEEEIHGLRVRYFAAADALGASPDRLLVDKLPLNILGIPLIHRLFPDARLVFAQRHPCDAVLSGFMQNFELNDAMACFLTLDGAASLYDAVLGFWSRCRSVLPLSVHTISYERLVVDPEAELRPLIDFLGLAWEERMLDHRKTARDRGIIITPSYSQVTQPLYRDASGRWQRYRAQMESVLPVLAPWVERLGYGTVDLPA